jgi:hypothetical protein
MGVDRDPACCAGLSRRCSSCCHEGYDGRTCMCCHIRLTAGWMINQHKQTGAGISLLGAYLYCAVQQHQQGTAGASFLQVGRLLARFVHTCDQFRQTNSKENFEWV